MREAGRSWSSSGGPSPGVRRPGARRSPQALRRPLGPRRRGCPRWVERAAAHPACRRSNGNTPRKQHWAVNAYVVVYCIGDAAADVVLMVEEVQERLLLLSGRLAAPGGVDQLQLEFTCPILFAGGRPPVGRARPLGPGAGALVVIREGVDPDTSRPPFEGLVPFDRTEDAMLHPDLLRARCAVHAHSSRGHRRGAHHLR